MPNPVYMDLYRKGVITRADYISAVGEDPEPEKSEDNAARDSMLETPGQKQKEKIDPAQQAAIDAKLREMGVDTVYRQPTPEELAQAEALASKPLEGTGLKCPRHHRLVTSCPDGNIRDCASSMRCAYASYEMHRTMGGRMNEQLDEQGQPVVDPMATTAIGRAAQMARGNNALTQQALALMKAREQAKKR